MAHWRSLELIEIKAKTYGFSSLLTVKIFTFPTANLGKRLSLAAGMSGPLEQ